MSTKCLQIIFKLDLKRIYIPGNRFAKKSMIILNIKIYDKFVEYLIPCSDRYLNINKIFYCRKIFESCFDPAHVSDNLSYEDVIIELTKIDQEKNEKVVLAYLVESLKNLLFPLPKYHNRQQKYRRLYLKPVNSFNNGVYPELQFLSESIISEKKLPIRRNLKIFPEWTVKQAPSYGTMKNYHCSKQLRNGIHNETCPFCYPIHAEHICTICKLYKRYFRKNYRGHYNLSYLENHEKLRHYPCLSELNVNQEK